MRSWKLSLLKAGIPGLENILPDDYRIELATITNPQHILAQIFASSTRKIALFT